MTDRDERLTELRWKKFPVLDDGFVCLVDVMGDDGAVVQAARVSYGEGTKRVSDDRTLIRYLMRHRHTTPFEMAELKLLVRVPMDCWRQWIRHRTASVNEYSTRYSIAIDAAQATPARPVAETGRRRIARGAASCCPPNWAAADRGRAKRVAGEAAACYQERLDRGVAREQARKDLPLSTYTEAYWKIDLHNLLHFLALRMDAHAQQEIRDYATSDRRANRRPAVSAGVGGVCRLPPGVDGVDAARPGGHRAADGRRANRRDPTPVRPGGLSGRAGRLLEVAHPQPGAGRMCRQAAATGPAGRRVELTGGLQRSVAARFAWFRGSWYPKSPIGVVCAVSVAPTAVRSTPGLPFDWPCFCQLTWLRPRVTWRSPAREAELQVTHQHGDSSAPPPLPTFRVTRRKFVVKLRLREHESISDAVKRFRKLVEHAGIKKEMRRREYYEKPSDQRCRARRRAERRAASCGCPRASEPPTSDVMNVRAVVLEDTRESPRSKKTGDFSFPWPPRLLRRRGFDRFGRRNNRLFDRLNEENLLRRLQLELLHLLLGRIALIVGETPFFFMLPL